MADRGSFIVFEGIDGCGKTTQTALLQKRLGIMGVKHTVTREQTGGPVGQLISRILTHQVKADDRVIAALFLADRLDHLTGDGGMLRLVQDGTHVICDRYYFSSCAYQGVRLPMEWIAELNRPCAELLRPDAVVFLDIAPERAYKRLCNDRRELELYEKLDFLEKVRGRYLEAFEKYDEAENIIIIKGDRPVELVEADIWEKIAGYYSQVGI